MSRLLSLEVGSQVQVLVLEPRSCLSCLIVCHLVWEMVIKSGLVVEYLS